MLPVTEVASGEQIGVAVGDHLPMGGWSYVRAATTGGRRLNEVADLGRHGSFHRGSLDIIRQIRRKLSSRIVLRGGVSPVGYQRTNKCGRGCPSQWRALSSVRI